MNRKLLTSYLRKADDSEKVTIFRVPLSIWESNKNKFEPSAVSIGPYHRGRPHLKAAEEKKWSFLQDFLDRKGFSLQGCISKVKEAEERARFCYSEPFDMSSDDFVEMLVLDGCFIIEYFHKYLLTQDYGAIFEGWAFSEFTKTDMILLENQIPYFVVEMLQGAPLDPLLLEGIARKLTRESKMPIKAPLQPQKIHHLLHLCLCYTVPTHISCSDAEPNHRPFLDRIMAVPVLKFFCAEKEEQLDERRMWEIPCATELKEAGVKFKTLKQSDDQTKITFQSGTLVIPRLFITDSVKPLFMNLVAMEQCMYMQLPLHFSTYMVFMDKLVNTAHDVRILQKKGIIESMLSSEEEVALFFNQSCVNVIIPPEHYLAELFKRINEYCESRYHRYRARLCTDYFSNPWSIIALVAATLLLCLTIIQSFMSVYAYVLPPSNPPSSPPS